jgi:hypothetical protein
VFSEWTSGLADAQAQQVCESLLPAAPELTTGQLSERIKRLAIAIDPDWSRRRYAEAVRERKVVGYRNEDGSANLCGYQLPADRAAAACAHLDALAKKVKRRGDGRSIDLIRADLYLAMLDGSYTGWPEQDIIAHILATAQVAPAERPEQASPGRNSQDRHGANAAPPHDPAPNSTAASPPGGQVLHGPWPPAAHQVALRPEPPPGAESAPVNAEPDLTERSDFDGEMADGAEGQCTRPVRRAGVEIRVEITTLLGVDEHPAEIAGWGFIDAELARGLVREQTAAEWRYAITDDDGQLLYEGITRRRPTGYPSRAASPCRGGIVELHIRHHDLRQFVARPQRLGGWDTVIADLICQADQHEQTAQPPAAPPTHDETRRDERGPRSPGKPMRRRTEIRDRTCIHPRCRTPAHGTDGDHIQQWARGGATWDGNIRSACRHDHRLRHDGGWRVVQLASGRLVWISRLGVHYGVRPPLIIQRLLDPAPREPAPPHQPDDHEVSPIWREPPASSAEPGRSPPPDPAEPIPF